MHVVSVFNYFALPIPALKWYSSPAASCTFAGNMFGGNINICGATTPPRRISTLQIYLRNNYNNHYYYFHININNLHHGHYFFNGHDHLKFDLDPDYFYQYNDFSDYFIHDNHVSNQIYTDHYRGHRGAYLYRVWRTNLSSCFA